MKRRELVEQIERLAACSFGTEASMIGIRTRERRWRSRCPATGR